MNMMTTIPPSGACPPPGARQRVPMPFADLLPHVDAALALSGVRATEFGHRLANDPGLIRDMRDRGRKPRAKLRLMMETYADRLIDQARERAFNVLLATGGERGVGAVVEGLIELLDRQAGDPDLEDGGDTELNGDEGDRAFTEWETRGRHKLGATGAESLVGGTEPDEDAEEDDPRELNGDETDNGGGEDEALLGYGLVNSNGPGCPISDPDYADEERLSDASWPERDRQPSEMLGGIRMGSEGEDDEDSDQDAEHDGREPEEYAS